MLNLRPSLFDTAANSATASGSVVAVALKLSLDETKQLLSSAGLTLSHSNRFDIIIEYFIRTGNYDMMEINEALYQYGQPCIGNVIE